MATLLIKPEEIRWGDEHAVGDSFNMQVYISDVEDCYGVQFEVKWDSKILELAVEPQRGDFLEENGVTTLWMQSYGEDYATCAYMRFQATSGVNIPSSELGLVATLTFRTKSKGTSSIDLLNENCLWVDSSYITYSFDVLVGSVFQFGAVAYPIMKIEEVRSPKEARSGDIINIEVDWKNLGEAGKAWLRVIDLTTNQELDSYQWNVGIGDEGTSLLSFNMPDRNLKARVEIGHVQ